MVPREKFGQLLTTDLTAGTCQLDAVPAPAVQYLGGRGFNIWYLHTHLTEQTDPLSPDNILVFSCGFLTGSSAPASARVHINALSPLTGILGSSNIGGYTGPWLRSCNIASIIVKGASKKPVMLYIDADGARLEDASSLWGCDSFETQEKINDLYKGKKVKILAIGPGGENRVRFAAVMSGRDHAAGRTGMGAVMGSKQLKAIVIQRGAHDHFKAVSARQKAAVRSYATAIREAPEFGRFSEYGGAGYIQWANEFGVMGSRNYAAIGIEAAEQIDGKRLKGNIVKKSGCFKCPVQCKADLKLDSEKGAVFTRPEFEPIINLGPKCGLTDLDRIIRLDNLCNRFGIDTTSTAGVIAFAMALSENGRLPRDLAGNLDLSWGNARAMERLICQIVRGKGLGRILRQGVMRAAQEIGNDAPDLAIHVKGLELTAYHPAALMGTALGYAVSSRGGDYNNVYASLEHSWTEAEALAEFGTTEAVNIRSTTAKAPLIKKAVITNIMVDSLGICKVPALSLLRSFNLENEARLVRDLTGCRVTPGQLAETGLKVASMERMFNITHATAPLKDRLPDIFYGNGERNTIQKDMFMAMLREFYTVMGWDENGVPPSPATKTKEKE